MVDLAEAKLFLRFDSDDEDGTITILIDAAADYLQSIGVDMTANPLPDAVVNAQLILIAHWFHFRASVDPKYAKGLDMSVNRLIAPHAEIAL